MPIKLRVTHGSDAHAPEVHVFDRETVMIGRDESNLLALPDPSRIVSKHHAEVRETEQGYELVDLGSKNFTYLNGKRLMSGHPSPLRDGDRFKIGEFEIAFEKTVAADEDRTVFAARFDDTPEETREEPAPPTPAAPPASAAPDPPAEQGEPARTAFLPFSPMGAPPAWGSDAPPSPPASASEGAGVGLNADEDRLLDTLVASVQSLLAVSHQLQRELTGSSGPDLGAPYTEAPRELRAYLTDADAEAEVLEARRNELAEAIAKAAIQPVALLDGYRAGVYYGLQQVLHAVDPARVEEEVSGSGLQKMLQRKGPAVVERLKELHAQLSTDGGAETERQMFRPPFAEAYRARLDQEP